MASHQIESATRAVGRPAPMPTPIVETTEIRESRLRSRQLERGHLPAVYCGQSGGTGLSGS